MRKRMLGPSGQILCEQFPWCQRKVMSMLLTLYFTWLTLISLSLGSLCKAHAFFPEHLSNHPQGLNCTFSDLNYLIFCKFTWWWPNIKAETCCEYRSYIIKYSVNCCEKEGIIYS
jgi:hypothetical protein